MYIGPLILSTQPKGHCHCVLNAKNTARALPFATRAVLLLADYMPMFRQASVSCAPPAKSVQGAAKVGRGFQRNGQRGTLFQIQLGPTWAPLPRYIAPRNLQFFFPRARIYPMSSRRIHRKLQAMLGSLFTCLCASVAGTESRVIATA
jgi:hypothetical protein